MARTVKKVTASVSTSVDAPVGNDAGADGIAGDDVDGMASSVDSTAHVVDGMTSNEGKAVMSAFAANVIVALAKLICGLFGVTAMLSEAVHSAADSLNEVALIVGRRKSHEPPTRDRPLGGSRARYFASFLVAVLLFGLGGVFTMSTAVSKVGAIVKGGPGAHDIDSMALMASIFVIIVSAFAEGWSIRTSIGEAKERWHVVGMRGRFSLVRFWVDTKSSDLTSVLAEDVLALAGLAVALIGCVLSLSTGDEIWDAFASLMIGLILVVGSVALGVQNASLLMGEGVDDAVYDEIMSVVSANRDVNAVLHPPIIYHLSEKRISGTLKLQFARRRGTTVESQINSLEDKIRAAVPYYTIDLWIEPDVYDPDKAAVEITSVD
jgi:cation diffusion facilitator family transporter